VRVLVVRARLAIRQDARDRGEPRHRRLGVRSARERDKRDEREHGENEGQEAGRSEPHRNASQHRTCHAPGTRDSARFTGRERVPTRRPHRQLGRPVRGPRGAFDTLAMRRRRGPGTTHARCTTPRAVSEKRRSGR
jgi:hypothetical protein